jgi:hypothetical protein
MSSKQSFWYRLGYALERTRNNPVQGARKLASLKERRNRRRAHERATHLQTLLPTDDLVASGIVAVVAKALDWWRPARKAGLTRLLQAGAAGAGAALLTELIGPLLRGERALPVLGEDTLDRILSGVGQGLVYGAVVEPRLPGPVAAKGALYGSAEYAVVPVGGLTRLLGPHAPLRRVPVLAHILEGVDPHDRAYVEHVAFGITLALLYGSSASSNGIRPDDE